MCNRDRQTDRQTNIQTNRQTEREEVRDREGGSVCVGERERE